MNMECGGQTSSAMVSVVLDTTYEPWKTLTVENTGIGGIWF